MQAGGMSGAETPKGESGLDLRRLTRRELASRIVARAAHLQAADRALVEAVFADGIRVTRLAKLTGRDVRELRRRVKGLARNLLSNRFTFVTSHSRDWSTTRRRVAIACILHGKTIRGAAAELGVGLHEVRREVEAVRAIYEHIMRIR